MMVRLLREPTDNINSQQTEVKGNNIIIIGPYLKKTESWDT